MTDDLFKYLIQRLVDSSRVDNGRDNDFNHGRKLGYYEVLDIINSELIIHELDPKDYGLDFKLEDIL